MRKTKVLVFSGIFLALLLGGQTALSSVAGIEIVTALFFCYCYSFGVFYGIIEGLAFSLLRCLIFGFYPSVVILYIVYYTLFAVIVGLFGKNRKYKVDIKSHIIAIILAVVLPILFTLIDDVVTPLFYGLSLEIAKGYFIASLSVMLPQVICSLITVGILFRIVVPLINKFREKTSES